MRRRQLPGAVFTAGCSDLVFVFNVSVYIPGIFYDVRQYDDADLDHAVAVYVYVCHSSRRRDQCDVG